MLRRGQAYPEIREAQRIAPPIAIGPAGPEILSYNLNRAILRDERFVMPPGMNLTAQGGDFRVDVGQGA